MEDLLETTTFIQFSPFFSSFFSFSFSFLFSLFLFLLHFFFFFFRGVLSSTETAWFIRDGVGGGGELDRPWEPKPAFLFIMMMMKWCLMSSDVSWHIRDKLWPMPKHGSIILYVHRNQKARSDGQPRTATSTAQDGHLDSHTVPELCLPVHAAPVLLTPCSSSSFVVFYVHKNHTVY